jgi:CubicO group peptidase (beta-lactamase class C family)
VENLHGTLKVYVDDGTLPGAVALVAQGNDEELAAVGSMAVGGAPMARDSIFRLASITKPITAAILLTQVGADSPVVPQWMRDFWQYAVGQG